MSEYQFTTDWFSTSICWWEAITNDLKPTRVLEIGSFEGRSAVYIINKIEGREGASLTCVDPWEDYWELESVRLSDAEKRFDYNTALALEGRNVTLNKMKGTSLKMLCKLIADDVPKFDLIYIDGSHMAADVLTDAVLSYPLLRKGGAMIFDDYAYAIDPVEAAKATQEPLKHPRTGIDAFAYFFGDKFSKYRFERRFEDGRVIDIEAECIAHTPGATTLYQLYLRKIAD
jgi:predicted O-methyltransferase YrrM